MMTHSDPAPARIARLRVARGPKRPTYLGDRDLDRVMMMLTALVGEVSALRDRVDTHERLALTGATPTPDAIEAFVPTGADVDRRGALREASLRRIYRVLFEELELARRAAAADAAAEPDATETE